MRLTNVYTKEEKKIFERVLNDYKSFKTMLNIDYENRICNNMNYNELQEFIKNIDSINFCNIFPNEGFDFNYKDMTLSIYCGRDGKFYLEEYFEVWNDNSTEYLGDFTVVDLLDILSNCGKEVEYGKK